MLIINPRMIMSQLKKFAPLVKKTLIFMYDTMTVTFSVRNAAGQTYSCI